MKGSGSTREQLVRELETLQVRLNESEVERQQAEKAGALLRNTLDSVSEPILLIGCDYRVKLMNKAAKASYSVVADSVPLYCYQISHNRDTPCNGSALPCPLQCVCETLQPVTVIHEHVQPGGRKRIVEIMAAPLLEADGQLAGVIESVRDVTERKRAEQALRESEQQYRTLNAKNKELLEGIRRQFLQRGELLKKLITAQEDERKRVARELHDELGQALSGLAFQTAAMKKTILADPHEASQQLDDICALIAQTTNQMYNLILSLRPAALDDLGLTTALYNCADHMLTDTAIRFEFDADGLTHRLSPEIETILYRIFQEALSNIVRHSQATQVGIRLALREGLFEGTIEDNGRGFDPETVLANKHDRCGLGLLGMQERATQCGGRLEVISQPGKGTCIRAVIPIQEGMLHE